MSTLPVTPWVTVEQFHNEAQWEHCHYLLHGEVRKDMGTAHFLHEQMKARLLQRLNEILQRRALAYGDTGYQIDRYTLLIPDVSVMWPVRKIRPDSYPEGAPELAVEILSPSNSAREYDEKARLYWANGSQAVWIIDAEQQRAFQIDRTGEWREVTTLSAILPADTAGELRIEIETGDLWSREG
jgi:Uma2 family endonuclease